MVSRIGKLLLVATSLAPVCGAFAIQRIAVLNSSEWMYDSFFWSWAVAAGGLALITYLFLLWCQSHLPRHPVKTTKVKTTDKDVLAFLLAYLIPFLGKDAFSYDRPIVAIYVYGLIFLAVYHSNSYHFNPLLALFGLHFYEVEIEGGYTAILVSKIAHAAQEQNLIVASLTPFLLLEINESRQRTICEGT